MRNAVFLHLRNVSLDPIRKANIDVHGKLISLVFAEGTRVSNINETDADCEEFCYSRISSF